MTVAFGTQFTIEHLIAMNALARKVPFSQYQQLASLRAGDHDMRLRGRGIEFEEVRAYQPGDDVSVMDWRVTARTGEPHVKVFREERDFPLILVIDFRQTMYFGSRKAFKSVQAAHLAALLAWTALTHGDRVGAIILAPDQTQVVPVTNSQAGILHLFNVMVAMQPRGASRNKTQTTWPDLHAKLHGLTSPGASIAFISDYNGLDETLYTQFKALRAKYSCLHFWIYDELERMPPPPNLYTVTDGQHKSLLNTFSRASVRDYTQAFRTPIMRLNDLCLQQQMPLFAIATHDALLNALLHGSHTIQEILTDERSNSAATA